ncbi:MAG: ATP-dependent Clp protease ATP-binding subunit [Candidatus Riflebacteria bacterium]|nr:ATP-dependent Clp protease ATP-binding subunit [Candidatus Riflebacteria bacterium]
MKFCESLDRFVAIRTFTAQQRAELFQNVKINDRKSYKRLIINAAVVNYLDEIAPTVFGNDEYPLLGEIIEQELYTLCIKVNPGLDIKEVTIPVPDDEADSAIPLLDTSPVVDQSPESSRIRNLEDEVKKRIVGQDEAVQVVCKAIRKAKVGLNNPRRPIGSFIFLGQTGVGKTELAKAVNQCLHGTEELIRVDCSEYAMSHEYSKLIGAPPGYIGHNDGGFLTESVKGRPRSVVVFDEIEKAHRKVHNVLLQILDEGILTDSKGQTVSFREAIIIMTSNIGVESLERLQTSIGFASQRPKIDHDLRSQETKKAMEKIFPPEFLNRIDEIVVFRTLAKNDNMLILDILLAEVHDRLANLGLGISFTPEAKTFLVDRGTDLKYGARPLRRAIHRYVENPLAELILNSSIRKNDQITVHVADEGDLLRFDTKPRRGGDRPQD